MSDNKTHDNPSEHGPGGGRHDVQGGGKDGGQDGDKMDALLNRIRDVAREEEAAIAGYSRAVTPLSVETRGRITELILQQQAREKVDAPTDDLALRRRLRSRRAISVVAVGIGAAAAALVFWARPDAEGTALPTYVVMATGGVMDVRGGAGPGAEQDEGPIAPTQRVRAQSELLITCRPDTAVTGAVAVRAFLVQGPDGSQQLSEIRPRVRVAPTGAVELRVGGAELLGRSPGHATLRVAVGRPDALRAIDGRAAITTSGGNGLRWLAVPLDLEASGP